MRMNYRQIVVLAVAFICLYMLLLVARHSRPVEKHVELDQHVDNHVELVDSSYTYPPYPTAMTVSGKDRRPSYPHITGDGFRALCPHRCELPGWKDAACDFKASDVQHGDCIYIATTDLTTFRTTTAYLHAFGRIRLDIKVPHTIITHNGDLSTPDGDNWHNNESNNPEWREVFSHWLDSRYLAQWFAVNCNWKGSEKGAIKPSKLTCIPIGFENRYNSHGGQLPSMSTVHKAYKKSEDGGARSGKHKLVLIDFSADDKWKPDRSKALSALESKDFVKRVKGLSYTNWRTAVKQLDFVACPHGHGLDTHRLWEVIHLGSIPIVRSSTLDEMYAHLPVLIVHTWEEVTLDRLQKFKSSPGYYKMNQIQMSFWIELIKNTKMPAIVGEPNLHKSQANCPNLTLVPTTVVQGRHVMIVQVPYDVTDNVKKATRDAPRILLNKQYAEQHGYGYTTCNFASFMFALADMKDFRGHLIKPFCVYATMLANPETEWFLLLDSDALVNPSKFDQPLDVFLNQSTPKTQIMSSNVRHLDGCSGVVLFHASSKGAVCQWCDEVRGNRYGLWDQTALWSVFVDLMGGPHTMRAAADQHTDKSSAPSEADSIWKTYYEKNQKSFRRKDSPVVALDNFANLYGGSRVCGDKAGFVWHPAGRGTLCDADAELLNKFRNNM